MAYCVESDVKAEFKNLEYDSSTITAAKVSEIISQEEAVINAKIGLKYSTPVVLADSPESVKILKMVSIWKSYQRVKDILKVQVGTDKLSQIAPDDKREAASKMLKEIVDGELPLPDATLAAASDGARSYVVDESEEHVMEKGVEQW